MECHSMGALFLLQNCAVVRSGELVSRKVIVKGEFEVCKPGEEALEPQAVFSDALVADAEQIGDVAGGVPLGE